MSSQQPNMRQLSVVLEKLFVAASQKGNTEQLEGELRLIQGSLNDPSFSEAVAKVIEAIPNIRDRESGSTMKAAMIEQYFNNAAKLLAAADVP